MGTYTVIWSKCASYELKIQMIISEWESAGIISVWEGT